MLPTVSKRWQFSLDLEDQSLEPVDLSAALRLARRADCGALSADGQHGDWVGLEFEGTRAEVWYKRTDGFLMRPYFPHRSTKEQETKAMFLKRDEGFQLFAELIRSSALPPSLPGKVEEGPILPGMASFFDEPADLRMVEWRVQCHAIESDGSL